MDMVSEGERQAEEFIERGRSRMEKDKAEKGLRKIRFKGKVVEITKEGEIKLQKKQKLSKKQIKAIGKKIQQIKKEKIKQSKFKQRAIEKARLKLKDIRQLRKDVGGLRQLTAEFPVTKRKPTPSSIAFIPERQDFQNPLYQPMISAIRDIDEASIPTIRAGLNSSIGIEQSANLTLSQSDREVELISALLAGRL